MFPAVMLILNVSSVAVLWFGGHRVEDGQMEVGALTAFLAYLVQILMSVMMATFMLMMVPRSAVCADRIVEVLDTDSSVVPPADPVTELRERGHARPSRTSSSPTRAPTCPSYATSRSRRAPGRPSRSSAPPAPARARWSTWCRGSSTSPAAGSSSAASTSATSTARCCGRRLGLVPQKAYLFSGTVASNLRYGKPDATDEEMWEALEIAQARDFVEAMPEGLDAPIAQGGTNVSGGQRQRLAIARALIRRPQIYLFDDSFSALDLATDARLRAALRPVTRDATVLLVAQRVSTIRDADLILVVEDGQVVGRGTHDELLADCGTYQEIVTSQLSAEEAVA